MAVLKLVDKSLGVPVLSLINHQLFCLYHKKIIILLFRLNKNNTIFFYGLDLMVKDPTVNIVQFKNY
jgi:hypothetical protein